MEERKKRLLIVDDEKIIRITFSRFLSKEGYFIETAESVDDALDKFNKAYFDLVITDLVMEDRNGIELLKEVKNINPEIPVLILTGYGDINSAVEAMRNNADDYLLKPFNMEELKILINKCLEKSEMQKKIKIYETILPVCCLCKKIRDDSGKEHGKGEWFNFDEFLHKKTGILPSHGYCPECAAKTKEEMQKYFFKGK
jgi:YesN/AraC family two-component response regulator